MRVGDEVGVGAVKSTAEAILWNLFSEKFLFKKKEVKQRSAEKKKKVQETKGLFLDQPLRLWIFYSGQGKKFLNSPLHIRCRTKMLQAQAGYCEVKFHWRHCVTRAAGLLVRNGPFLCSVWGSAQLPAGASLRLPVLAVPNRNPELIHNVWHWLEKKFIL